MPRPRYWPQVFQFRRRPESREIRHHAQIGGTVAAVLTVLEILRSLLGKRLEDQISQWPRWEVVLALTAGLFVVVCLTFGFAFLAIQAMEVWLRRPLSVPHVGDVDGVWVYALRDVDGVLFNRGSIMEIESLGVLFQIRGWSYEAPEHRSGPSLKATGLLKAVGEFHADGVLWDLGRIHYSYYGKRNGIDDSGVGYYAFNERDGDFTVEGRFTGSSLGPDGKTGTRFLKGKRVCTSKAKHQLGGTDKDVRNKLEALLEEEMTTCSQDPAVQFALEPVGAVDGCWIDAIYEKTAAGVWNLLQGSVMRVNSSGEAKRFAVKGWTYVAKELLDASDPKMIRPPHSFQSEGSQMKNAPGFYYHYSGFEGDFDLGVGYYIFRSDDAERLTFSGEFMRFGSARRIMYGRPIAYTDWDKRAELLKELFQECERQLPPEVFALQQREKSRIDSLIS